MFFTVANAHVIPPSVDPSKAAKLKYMEFPLYEADIKWVNAMLRTAKFKNLQKINIHFSNVLLVDPIDDRKNFSGFAEFGLPASGVLCLSPLGPHALCAPALLHTLALLALIAGREDFLLRHFIGRPCHYYRERYYPRWSQLRIRDLVWIHSTDPQTTCSLVSNACRSLLAPSQGSSSRKTEPCRTVRFDAVSHHIVRSELWFAIGITVDCLDPFTMPASRQSESTTITRRGTIQITNVANNAVLGYVS